MNLLLQTGGRCDFDPGHVLDVFSQQRQRFVTKLQGFGPADWAAPTRCTEWSAHEVVRHLCNTNMNAIAIGPDDRAGRLSWLRPEDHTTPVAECVCRRDAGRHPPPFPGNDRRTVRPRPGPAGARPQVRRPACVCDSLVPSALDALSAILSTAG
jgi:Mycothiol maleylpyruvate isomerase N-terminal domain